jgi:hypothetical protein
VRKTRAAGPRRAGQKFQVHSGVALMIFLLTRIIVVSRPSPSSSVCCARRQVCVSPPAGLALSGMQVREHENNAEVPRARHLGRPDSDSRYPARLRGRADLLRRRHSFVMSFVSFSIANRRRLSRGAAGRPAAVRRSLSTLATELLGPAGRRIAFGENVRERRARPAAPGQQRLGIGVRAELARHDWQQVSLGDRIDSNVRFAPLGGRPADWRPFTARSFA